MLSREMDKRLGAYYFHGVGFTTNNVGGIDYANLHGVDSFIKELQLFLHNIMNV
jgi:hypothetical protein